MIYSICCRELNVYLRRSALASILRATSSIIWLPIRRPNVTSIVSSVKFRMRTFTRTQKPSNSKRRLQPRAIMVPELILRIDAMAITILKKTT